MWRLLCRVSFVTLKDMFLSNINKYEHHMVLHWVILVIWFKDRHEAYLNNNYWIERPVFGNVLEDRC